MAPDGARCRRGRRSPGSTRTRGPVRTPGGGSRAAAPGTLTVTVHTDPSLFDRAQTRLRLTVIAANAAHRAMWLRASHGRARELRRPRRAAERHLHGRLRGQPDREPLRGDPRLDRRPRARRFISTRSPTSPTHEDRRRRLAALPPAHGHRQLHPRLARGNGGGGGRPRAGRVRADEPPRAGGDQGCPRRHPARGATSCGCPRRTRCEPAWSRLGRPPVEWLAGRLDAFLFSEWMYPAQRARRARDRLPRSRATPPSRVVHAPHRLDAHPQGPQRRRDVRCRVRQLARDRGRPRRASPDRRGSHRPCAARPRDGSRARR